MQLQPVSTRQDSVTEKQLHFPVLKVGRGACFRPGFHSHTVISVYPAKLPTLLRAYQKTPGRHWANPLPGHTSGGATMGHKQPGKALIHQPVQVDGHWGGMQPGCPGVPQSVGTGPFLTAPHSGAQPDFLPPGPGEVRAQRPGFGSYHFAVLGLSPVPRGRGVRTAAAPSSALTGRKGVERGAGAGGQPRVRAVQQAFPALLLQALVHPLQL